MIFGEYDPAVNNWIKRTAAGGPVRWFGSSFSVGNKGYVGLGTGDMVIINHTDLWQYTPE